MTFEQQLVLSILPIMCSSVLGYVFAEFKAKKSKENLYDTVIRVVLHELIMNKCEKLLKQKIVSLDDYEDLLALNKPYMAVHGNGTAKAAIQKVELKLGIKRED